MNIELISKDKVKHNIKYAKEIKAVKDHDSSIYDLVLSCKDHIARVKLSDLAKELGLVYKDENNFAYVLRYAMWNNGFNLKTVRHANTNEKIAVISLIEDGDCGLPTSLSRHLIYDEDGCVVEMCDLV